MRDLENTPGRKVSQIIQLVLFLLLTLLGAILLAYRQYKRGKGDSQGAVWGIAGGAASLMGVPLQLAGLGQSQFQFWIK